MIENKYEERQVTQRVLIDHTYVCDVCGRKMKIPQHYWMVSITKVDKMTIGIKIDLLIAVVKNV